MWFTVGKLGEKKRGCTGGSGSGPLRAVGSEDEGVVARVSEVAAVDAVPRRRVPIAKSLLSVDVVEGWRQKEAELFVVVLIVFDSIVHTRSE